MGLIANTTAALAGNPECSAYGHCYSIELAPSSINDGTYYSGEFTTNLAYMQSGGSSRSDITHIDSEMWVDLPGDHNWIEAGIYDGFVMHPGDSQCGGFGGCTYSSFESGSGASSDCVNNGCGAYTLFWADAVGAGNGHANVYEHFVRFTSPNASSVLHTDIGYVGNGRWQIHMYGISGLDYYGFSTIEASTVLKDVNAGAELAQAANGGACANTFTMTFSAARPGPSFTTWVAQSPTTAHVDAGFNGTQQTPAPRPGTWLWNLPTSANPNGC